MKFDWRALAPDELPSERRLLLLLGVASLFGQYDTQLFSLLLVQIQEELAIPEAALGYLGSLTRMGALPAFAALILADRVGRRAVLLWTIAGYTLATAATALSPNYWWFIGCQFLATMFLTAEFLLALIVIVEEFRPSNRGWGVGVLGALAIAGRGIAVGLFAFVDDIPFGWRGLYGIGVVPLLLLTVLRRRLPETRRFTALPEDLPDEGFWIRSLRPVRELARAYPGRFVAVAMVGFLWSFSNTPVDFFLPKFTQEMYGWSPAQFARIVLLGGLLGFTGLLFGGWVSDRYGRKPTLTLFLVLEPLFAIVLYTIVGNVAAAIYIVWMFASVANDTIGRTFATELFPTSYRATAAGARSIAGALGAVLGLACEGLLYGIFGSHWTPVRIAAAAGFLMPLIVLLVYPETSGRTLEEIAPEPKSRVSSRAPSAIARG